MATANRKVQIALGQQFKRLLVKDRLGQNLDVVVNADDLNDVELSWIDYFGLMFPGAGFVAGLPRTGKTMYMGFVAYVGKKYFDIDTVADTIMFRSPQEGGSALLHGSYKYMDDELLLQEKQQMLQTSKDFRDKFNVDPKFREKTASDLWAQYEAKSKISLHRKIILYDEVYQKMERRRALDPMNLLYGHQLKQYGHYYSLFLLAAPQLKECDDRVQDNICLEIGTTWEKYGRVKIKGEEYAVEINTAHYRVYDRDSKLFLPRLHLEGPKWWPLIYSFQMVAPRKRMIGSEKEG
jgi:hypothetical protein